MKNNKYYDIRNLIKKVPDASYYFAIGPRSNGKTYSALDYALEQYFKTGKEFAIIRRWLDDFKGRRGQAMFAAHENNSVIQKYSGGAWSNVVYKSMQFYLGKYLDGKLVLSDKPIGYAFPVSQMEHDKSTSYNNVCTIIFDEVLTRSEYGYLANEFVLFMNVISTIIRDRGTKDDIKIIMLGNTVSFYSPYFNEMGLTNIKKMEPGSIDVYEYGDSGLKVAVEYTEQIKSKVNSNKYYAFNNPRLKMITGTDGNSWEIDSYPHLMKRYKPNQIIFTYFIVFDGCTMQCEVINDEGNIYTYIHRKTTEIRRPESDFVFSPAFDTRPNWNPNILKIHNRKLKKAMQQIFDVSKICYQDNELGEYMRNYLEWCKDN